MVEINNKTKVKIDKKLIKKIAEKFLKEHKLGRKEVSIAFIGDEKMRKLNKKYRRVDRTTDVLAFLGEEESLGEILISLPQLKRQAGKNKKTPKYELAFVLIHGLLHLAGYSDKTERNKLKMLKLGEEFLKTIKLKV